MKGMQVKNAISTATDSWDRNIEKRLAPIDGFHKDKRKRIGRARRKSLFDKSPFRRNGSHVIRNLKHFGER
jgi:hypothetical protein